MNCFDIITMGCTIYIVSCNSTTIATCTTCPLTLMVYKYNEMQMSYATQKLSCKANCKHFSFHSGRKLIIYIRKETM